MAGQLIVLPGGMPAARRTRRGADPGLGTLFQAFKFLERRNPECVDHLVHVLVANYLRLKGPEGAALAARLEALYPSQGGRMHDGAGVYESEPTWRRGPLRPPDR